MGLGFKDRGSKGELVELGTSQVTERWRVLGSAEPLWHRLLETRTPNTAVPGNDGLRRGFLCFLVLASTFKVSFITSSDSKNKTLSWPDMWMI